MAGQQWNELGELLMDPRGRTIQKLRFRIHRRHFLRVYTELKKIGPEPFVMPFWNSVNKMVTREFLPLPPIDFLAIQAIKDTMFIQPSQKWVEAELNFLKKSASAKLPCIAKEDSVGRPQTITAAGASSSYNTLHHLYHIYFFLSKTKLKIDNLEIVVEWGGGYGNMAKLWKRLNPECTYIIVDTALFCSVQWLYLASVFGKDSVKILKSESDVVSDGKINLIPLALLATAPKSCDLFISTWGLSESATKAQDYVLNKAWFGAKHLLIGFQDSTKELEHASRLGKLAAKSGAAIIDIEFIPNNHYAFK